MPQRSSIFHYVGIALAVFTGALAAGVAWLYISAHVAKEALEQTAEHIAADVRDRQEKREAELDERRQALELKRIKSEIGRDLGRRCQEFTIFLRDNPGDYAREQRVEACRRFEIFIETGRVFDKLPERGKLRQALGIEAPSAPASPYDLAMARMQSEAGVGLGQRCRELIAAYVQQPSADARDRRESACKRFERYLDTGQIAP